MQEKTFYLGEGDDKVLLAFNLNVMSEIQKKYGSVSKWVDLLEDDDEDPKRGGEPDMDAFLSGFTIMLNEGVEIENEDNGADKKPYTTRQVGRLISKWGQDAVADAMKNAIAGSTDTGEKSKNGSTKTKTTTA